MYKIYLTESCWCTGFNSVFGNITKTETGKECQKWSEQYPHAHSQEGAENHCLVNTHYGPWCYTTDPDTRWEVISKQSIKKNHFTFRTAEFQNVLIVWRKFLKVVKIPITIAIGK